MSLKAFHIVFCIASILLTLGFGVWAVEGYARTGSAGSLALAATSLAIGFALVFYSKWFVRKLRHVSYL